MADPCVAGGATKAWTTPVICAVGMDARMSGEMQSLKAG
jgi:hypothetical protein